MKQSTYSKRSRDGFWVHHAPAKAIGLFVALAAILILVNLLVFQTSCSYEFSPQGLCWENKPAWIHPAWVFPISLAALAGFIYLLIRKFN